MDKPQKIRNIRTLLEGVETRLTSRAPATPLSRRADPVRIPPPPRSPQPPAAPAGAVDRGDRPSSSCRRTEEAPGMERGRRPPPRSRRHDRAPMRARAWATTPRHSPVNLRSPAFGRSSRTSSEPPLSREAPLPGHACATFYEPRGRSPKGNRLRSGCYHGPSRSSESMASYGTNQFTLRENGKVDRQVHSYARGVGPPHRPVS